MDNMSISKKFKNIMKKFAVSQKDVELFQRQKDKAAQMKKRLKGK